MTDSTGLTKDSGWEMGVRRTTPVPLPLVWQFLMGRGLPLWLGVESLEPVKGTAYTTPDGITGYVRSYNDRENIRLSWKPADWPQESTLQVRVLQARSGTTIAIHQERLASKEIRTQMIEHWRQVLVRLENDLVLAVLED